ncbi:MAG: 1-acyl-sn-glycerol-3-phosphate acyltransferase [Prevotella sp.]|nr:1-acyl-sn-glycerol-3-phosphate acyltransferase [Prevotella sp.]
MKYLYRIYQLLIALPLGLFVTLLVAVVTAVGCSLGKGHFWGYYPGHLWGRIILWLFLIPVKVEGKLQLEKNQSYVFVANHQGAFDIFLIYGYLGRNFKWMMKQSLRKLPFVGWACEKSKQIFVDKSGASRIKKTYEDARCTLQGGTSLTVFPEGARTFTGQMQPFKRGAFALADELQLPVVPLTINGSFHLMPRMRDGHFVQWHRLSLTIHQPIYPVGQGAENVQATMSQAYDSVHSALNNSSS